MAQLVQFEKAGTHRLIPTRYGAESVLESLPLPADVLADLSELDAATNERKIAERGGNTAIGPGELLLGVPAAHIVNAAFTHAGPFGGRFHGPQRGAWYAGFEIETSVAEVAFHKRRFLADGRIQGQHAFDYIDFLANFSGLFHTLDAAEQENCSLARSCSAVVWLLAGAGEQTSIRRVEWHHVSERSPAQRDLHRVFPSGARLSMAATQEIPARRRCGDGHRRVRSGSCLVEKGQPQGGAASILCMRPQLRGKSDELIAEGRGRRHVSCWCGLRRWR